MPRYFGRTLISEKKYFNMSNTYRRRPIRSEIMPDLNSGLFLHVQSRLGNFVYYLVYHKFLNPYGQIDKRDIQMVAIFKFLSKMN